LQLHIIEWCQVLYKLWTLNYETKSNHFEEFDMGGRKY
jgi:hypothetical protein